MKVTITYSDESILSRIPKSENITLLDVETLKGKKEAFKLKSHWGARLDPFILLEDNGKAIKAFYSEAGNAVEDFLKYIQNEDISNRRYSWKNYLERHNKERKSR